MHTFEITFPIDYSMFLQLMKLPSIKKASSRVYRTNYYSKKGITQIELRIYQYVPKNSGIMLEKYYLVLRCNAGVIMGENPILALDMNKYTKEEIVSKLQNIMYEIDVLRFFNIHKYDMIIWKTNRIDIAKDIFDSSIDPTLAIILCNLSFPYNYYRMNPVKIEKDKYLLMTESCYFRSKSRTINIYFKLVELNNNHKIIDEDTLNLIEKMIRIEIQIEKKGITNLNRNKQEKRSLEQFLDGDFCYAYLEKEILSIFGAEKYVNTTIAINQIQRSAYSNYDKTVLSSILRMIHKYNGLYELEKAIADVNVFTPTEYGNLRQFREKWLKKIRALEISPVTIPDHFGIMEFPSIYQLLKNQKGEN